MHIKPGAALLPNRADSTAQTRCTFEPLTDPENPSEALYVSGKSNPVERIRSLKAMVRELARPRAATGSRFETEFKELDESRRRILLVVGSYSEAGAVGEALISTLEQVGDIPPQEQVLVLIPDSEAELDMPTPTGKLYRSMLQQLATKPARFLVAPLQAIERGHNILVGQQAAIGSVYFLTRPMPIPVDIQAAVQRLNSWSVRTVPTLQYPTIGEAGLELRNRARRRWEEALEKKETYGGLNDEERKNLLWTQLVLVWQCVGRLLRGGVAARVHFIDAKWAPVSARLAGALGDFDTEETSMLIGFKYILQEALNDIDPINRAIAQTLYGSFDQALQNIKGVRYG